VCEFPLLTGCQVGAFLACLTRPLFEDTIPANFRLSENAPPIQLTYPGPPSRWAFRIAMTDDCLESILALLKQLEATLLGLRQLRGYVGQGVGQQMLEELIEEGETKLSEMKRKLIQ
jgi:hypothetical protein